MWDDETFWEVSVDQLTFMQRTISDNTLLAEEMLHGFGRAITLEDFVSVLTLRRCLIPLVGKLC